MSIITTKPPPSLWESVCQELQEERERFEREDGEVEPKRVQHFDPSRHHPAFYGKAFAHIPGDYSVKTELDQSVGHPSYASYWTADESVTESVDLPKPLKDRKTCTNREYLELYVWPSLLPALENTLVTARSQGSFGLKKVQFNSLDYLTEFLYNHNPLHPEDERKRLPLFDIPFVKDWLKLHPRPPQPVSLTWTEDETATKIQSAWRGYLVRRDPEVQELRKWQEEWRFFNREDQIQEEVSGFWDRIMPDAPPSSSSDVHQNPGSSAPLCPGTLPHTASCPDEGCRLLKQRKSSHGASMTRHFSTGSSPFRLPPKQKLQPRRSHQSIQ
ncbi:IQ domain-containing protein K-like [Babylonia areolata]|uniref:IQ domain-containing protein K-like n=1 Tax=Babylonia areolata TaxID=304850 RepID=UPI003FD2597F